MKTILCIFLSFCLVSLSFSDQMNQPSPQLNEEDLKRDLREKLPWSIVGTVVDENGEPMEGVKISAHCGMGTLMPTGSTTSDKMGEFELRFGPGIHFLDKDKDEWGVGLQASTISARLDGYYEKNLARHGGLFMAGEPPKSKNNSWGVDPKEVVIPNVPKNLDFIMVEGTTINARVVNLKGDPLSEKRLCLNSKDNYPSQSVIACSETDERGIVVFESIPRQEIWFEFKGQKSLPINFKEPMVYDVEIVYDEKEELLDAKILSSRKFMEENILLNEIIKMEEERYSLRNNPP